MSHGVVPENLDSRFVFQLREGADHEQGTSQSGTEGMCCMRLNKIDSPSGEDNLGDTHGGIQ